MDFKFDFLSFLASEYKIYKKISIIRSSEQFQPGGTGDFVAAVFHVAINLSRCKAVLSSASRSKLYIFSDL